MKKLLLASVLLMLPALPAFAADSPWVGTWRLDLAKSKFTGDTFIYSKSGNGLYHYSDGISVNFDFGIDGKEYKTTFGATATWTAAGENAWDSISKVNNAVYSKEHSQLSPDGKTLTVTDSGTKPDGSTFNDESVYTRVTGRTGFIGKWRSTKVNISAPGAVIESAPSDGVVRWEFTDFKTIVEGKCDGSDLPYTGPSVAAGTTVSIKNLSSRKRFFTVKFAGKPMYMAIQTASADGKTITQVGWSPGKESEKSTAVYARQ